MDDGWFVFPIHREVANTCSVFLRIEGLILSSLKIDDKHFPHPRISSFCVVVVVGNVVCVHTTTGSVCCLSCSEFFSRSFALICAIFFLLGQNNRFLTEMHNRTIIFFSNFSDGSVL